MSVTEAVQTEPAGICCAAATGVDTRPFSIPVVVGPLVSVQLYDTGNTRSGAPVYNGGAAMAMLTDSGPICWMIGWVTVTPTVEAGVMTTGPGATEGVSHANDALSSAPLGVSGATEQERPAGIPEIVTALAVVSVEYVPA